MTQIKAKHLSWIYRLGPLSLLIIKGTKVAKTFQNMKNSHSLRIDLFTDHEGLHLLIKQLLADFNTAHAIGPKPKGVISGLAFYQTAKILVENFIYAKLDLVSLSLSNDYYANMPDRYNPQSISAYKLRSVVKFLKDSGLIIVHKGIFTKTFCVRTRLEPTKDFKTLIRAIKLKKSELTMNEKMERIILKDRSEDNRKIYVDYEDTEETNGAREFIKNYETFINQFKFISAEGNFNRISVKRVFNNGKFTDGGRFYCDYQNLKSEIRAHTMTCDGIPLKEFDFKGMHINMLYSKSGLPHPEEDVYTISGFEHYRNLFKIALQIALNATSSSKAILGMNKHLIDNKINLREINGKIILEAFTKKHEKIKEYFFSGIGVVLQNEDSQICELILRDAIKNDIPVLSVHDSFLTRECDKDFLLGAMAKYSKQVIGQELKVEGK